jgi:hypothetical protein
MSEFKAEDYRLREAGGGRREAASASPDYPREELTHARSHAGVVSFLSSNERQGRWEMPRHFRALAVLGSVELDLREAEIGYGVSVIEAVAVMGSIELTIPPQITVECDGDSLLGAFTLKYAGASPTQASPDRVIRITGTAYVGAVTVTVKGPSRKMLERLARRLGMESE